MNSFTLIGNLTKDPEIRHTSSGKAVANFTIAWNDPYAPNEPAYFSCAAWGKTGEVIVEYCKKGSKVGVTGTMKMRSWEDQNGNKRTVFEINVREVDFLTPKNENSKSNVKESVNSNDNPFNDDDILF